MATGREGVRVRGTGLRLLLARPTARSRARAGVPCRLAPCRLAVRFDAPIGRAGLARVLAHLGTRQGISPPARPDKPNGPRSAVIGWRLVVPRGLMLACRQIVTKW